jgi:hypothetical protein
VKKALVGAFPGWKNAGDYGKIANVPSNHLANDRSCIYHFNFKKI